MAKSSLALRRAAPAAILDGMNTHLVFAGADRDRAREHAASSATGRHAHTTHLRPAPRGPHPKGVRRQPPAEATECGRHLNGDCGATN